MKERVVAFGDAIVAIIITIMVLEVPIEFMANGDVDLGLFFKTIGIYFISYCFVAHIWFQTAYSFNQVKELRNREIINYMMMLFLLSIVPSATRLLIEDTARETVLVYGVLTLFVTIAAQRLDLILTKQWVENPDTLIYHIRDFKRKSLIDIGFRLALLVLGYFYVQSALVIYLVLSVLGLLENVADREENGFVGSLSSEDQLHYFKGRDQLFGDSRKRQLMLVRNSLQDEEVSTENWRDFMEAWRKQLDEEITRKQTLLREKKEGDSSYDSVNQDICELKRQRDRLAKHQQDFQNREQRLIKRAAREKEHTARKEAHQASREVHETEHTARKMTHQAEHETRHMERDTQKAVRCAEHEEKNQ